MAAAVAVLVLAAAPCRAQDAAPQFTPLEKGTGDSVDQANLNVNVQVPLAHTTGRGLGLNLALVTNSNNYAPSSGAWSLVGSAVGWWVSDNGSAHVGDMKTLVECSYMDPNTHQIRYTSTWKHWEFVYVDPNGLRSTFYVSPYYDAATPCHYSPVGPGPGAYAE